MLIFFSATGEIFSISESYAFKRYRYISKWLMKALNLPNDQALTAANLKVVADVTEQAIERPVAKQKSYYSGKKNETLLIDCFLTGIILAMRSARGSMHDFEIMKLSKLKINADANIKTDKGFLGIKKLYPNEEVPFIASAIDQKAKAV